MVDNQRWLPVLIGCILLGIVHGQELWSGTHAGMSPDEVVRLVPNAYRTTAGPDFRAFEEWPRMSLQARVDRVDVLGANAQVMFGFINNGLERIVLGFSTDGMSISAFDNQCRTLRAALNGRFGPEGSASEDRRETRYSDGESEEYLRSPSARRGC